MIAREYRQLMLSSFHAAARLLPLTVVDTRCLKEPLEGRRINAAAQGVNNYLLQRLGNNGKTAAAP